VHSLYQLVAFLGFIIHEHGIEIDPKKIESINKVQPLQCKNDIQ
jgi:hypothetical protein